MGIMQFHTIPGREKLKTIQEQHEQQLQLEDNPSGLPAELASAPQTPHYNALIGLYESKSNQMSNGLASNNLSAWFYK